MLVATGITGCTRIPQADANIVFMGDSITAFWSFPKSNLGISGNTTSQMLARFPTEVPGHNYKAIVILGGTNDVRITSSPIQQEVDTAIANIEQMAALADKENLVVVLCKIPPILNGYARSEAMNAAIENLAQQHQYKLVDYYTPLAGHPEDFRDVLHPNFHGYFKMQAALTEVLPPDF